MDEKSFEGYFRFFKIKNIIQKNKRGGDFWEIPKIWVFLGKSSFKFLLHKLVIVLISGFKHKLLAIIQANEITNSI